MEKKRFKIVSICQVCKGEGHFESPLIGDCPFCGSSIWVYWRQPLIKDGSKKRIIAGAYIGKNNLTKGATQ